MTTIYQFTNTDTNVFAPLQSSIAPYAIAKPFTQIQKAEAEKEKEKKNHHWGVKIATAALVAGFGVFALTKGMSRGTSLKVNEIIKSLEMKTKNLNKNKNRNSLQTLYLSLLQTTKNIFEAAQTIAPLKDVWFKKISKKVSIIDKFSKAITNIFENISVKTSKRAYSKTLKMFDTMCADFDAANVKISDSTISKNLAQRIRQIKINYVDNFSESAQNKRLAEAKKDMGNIDENFWNATWGHILQYLKNPNTYKTFISKQLAAPAKIKLNNSIRTIKDSISISRMNNYETIKQLMENIDTFINPSDTQSLILLQNIRKNLNNYRKILTEGSKTKAVFSQEELTKNLNALNSLIKKGNYEPQTAEQLSITIKNLCDTLSQSKQGEIQKILEEYKKLLSEKDYLLLEKSVNKTLKSFDNATDIETDKLFDKIRDIQIGSAPMDVLGMISSFAIIGIWLAKSDNRDERISAALKYGIPAIGAVAISTYCTLGLVSGGKALIIGLIAGQLMNILGVIADKAIKKYNNQTQ